jgi:D-inositol-3-phosphate glycosyltransferase
MDNCYSGIFRAERVFRDPVRSLQLGATDAEYDDEKAPWSSGPMKVLIVATFIPPHVGGLEIVVVQQAKSLADAGHEVTVFTGRHDKSLPRDEKVDGYRVIRTPVWNAIEERTGVPYPIWGVRSFVPLVRLVRQADVVHVHDVYYQTSILAAMIARWAQRRLFVTQHVSIVEHDNPLVMGVQRFVYGTAGRKLWQWSRGIVAYNVIVERFLADRHVPPEKVHLCYNGIDVDAFRPGDKAVRASVRSAFGLPQDKPLVIFVGRLVPKKGYRELMAAHHDEYHIVLAGSGAIPSVVPSGVTFVGPVDRSELLGLYQASDIFALPAVGEMLTLAMQEAMACGLPVVATKDAAYDSYELDSNGIAFTVPEPDVLRKTFLEILEDPERYDRMRTYSRQLAETRFDWRRNAANLADLYCEEGLAGRRHWRRIDPGPAKDTPPVDVSEPAW